MAQHSAHYYLKTDAAVGNPRAGAFCRCPPRPVDSARAECVQLSVTCRLWGPATLDFLSLPLERVRAAWRFLQKV